MPLTKLLGIDLPLLQAPMAGVQDHRLAAAVCNAGGLGALPCAMLDPATLARELAALRAATPRPFNLNFFCHRPPEPDAAAERRWRQALAPYYAELGLDPDAHASAPNRTPFSAAIADLLEDRPPAVVSFHFGLPEPELLARVKAWGSKVLSSATTLEEGLWLQEHGVDAVIAQGLEAGGHRGHFLRDDLDGQRDTLPLLEQLADALDVPVIAAGGIATASDVHAALARGAAAVQVGSAFLRSREASTSALHRALLAEPQARDTTLTNLFSGRPARGIRNRLMRELGPLSELPPAFPLASAALAPLRAAAEARGLGDFSPLWSGTRGHLAQAQPAAEICRALMEGL